MNEKVNSLKTNISLFEKDLKIHAITQNYFYTLDQHGAIKRIHNLHEFHGTNALYTILNTVRSDFNELKPSAKDITHRHLLAIDLDGPVQDGIIIARVFCRMLHEAKLAPYSVPLLNSIGGIHFILKHAPIENTEEVQWAINNPLKSIFREIYAKSQEETKVYNVKLDLTVFSPERMFSMAGTLRIKEQPVLERHYVDTTPERIEDYNPLREKIVELAANAQKYTPSIAAAQQQPIHYSTIAEEVYSTAHEPELRNIYRQAKLFDIKNNKGLCDRSVAVHILASTFMSTLIKKHGKDMEAARKIVIHCSHIIDEICKGDRERKHKEKAVEMVTASLADFIHPDTYKKGMHKANQKKAALATDNNTSSTPNIKKKRGVALRQEEKDRFYTFISARLKEKEGSYVTTEQFREHLRRRGFSFSDKQFTQLLKEKGYKVSDFRIDKRSGKTKKCIFHVELIYVSLKPIKTFYIHYTCHFFFFMSERLCIVHIADTKRKILIRGPPPSRIYVCMLPYQL